MDATAWDERYAASELVWSATPNGTVAQEFAGLTPGRALDVACGEGRHARWLAENGWDARGIDFSSVAIERARELATAAGVAARFDVVDVTTDPVPDPPYDAIVLAYLQLPAALRRAAHRAVAAALAPGGFLLVVAHDVSNLTDGVGGPQDPAVLFGPDDVTGDLDGLAGLKVERAETIRRPVGDEFAIDTVVRVRRV